MNGTNLGKRSVGSEAQLEDLRAMRLIAQKNPVSQRKIAQIPENE